MIEDAQTGLRLSVLPDRAQGGTSLADG